MFPKDNEVGLEIIAVKSGDGVCGTYRGFGGTFATFVDCCLRKKALAGFYDNGLIAEAERKENHLLLTLSGTHTQMGLMEIMDIALQNIGAYPDKGGNGAFFIEVRFAE